MSKRTQAITIFNAQLATKDELGNTKFRRNVIEAVMAQTQSSHAGAAAMYNFAKKKAQEAGDIEVFGRVATEEGTKTAQVKVPKVVVEQAPEVEEEEVFELLKFAVVDKDGEIIDTFNSKSTAYRARNKDAGEKVMLTEKVAK